MNKNDLVNVKITDLGTDGEGIGKIDGFTLFVKGAVPGDLVRAHILKSKKTYAYAKIEEILEASTDRVKQKCPVADKCGGCRIQQLSYEKQLDMKCKKVKDCLTRLGGVDADELEQKFEGIIGMEEPWHYRNKAQYPIALDKDGNVKIGCYAYHSHTIIENDECDIENPLCSAVIKALRKVISKFNLSVYDEVKAAGELRHCLIRHGKETKEVMVCLVINAGKREIKNWSEQSQAMKELIDLLKVDLIKSGFNLSNLCLNINREPGNVILGTEVIPVFGPLYITDKIGDVSFRISPLSFYQVNPVQTKKLYDKALEYAQLTGNETVWDLYCGIGTISLFLAQKAKKVYGVEIVPQAIENAKENALLNGITNAEFFCGAAEDALPKLNHELTEAASCDVVVVDPPRAGCDEVLLDTIVKMNPERIVYVSCDPATLGRDVKILTQKGYGVQKVTAVDQFCHTMHVETCVLLSKVQSDKHIDIKIELGEADITKAESKATYEEIKKYIADHYDGMKVHNQFIAQVKAEYGIREEENHRPSKKSPEEQAKLKRLCPENQKKAIEEAMRYFRMI